MQQLKITIETNRKITVTRNKWTEDWRAKSRGGAQPQRKEAVITPVQSSHRITAVDMGIAPATAKGLTKEAFDGLLSYLDGDRDEAGKIYEGIRRNLIRLFERHGCALPEDLTDETINRVAGKIMRGARIWAAQPMSYFYGVAWNVLMDQRRLQRNALPLDWIDESRCFENPFDVQESQSKKRRLEQLLQTLDTSLQELPSEWRDLILEYYNTDNISKVESRRRLAERLGIPANALRIRACRIRAKLKARFGSWLDEAGI